MNNLMGVTKMNNLKDLNENVVIDFIDKYYQKKQYIDIVDIANELGIDVYSDNLGKEPAYIEYEKDTNSFFIVVNEENSEVRQRFSVAHELAHFILHQDNIKKHGRVGREAECSLTIKEEREADTLAAKMLMPQEIFSQGLDKNQKVSEDQVQRLASKFQVSKIAAIRRLRELGFYVPYYE